MDCEELRWRCGCRMQIVLSYHHIVMAHQLLVKPTDLLRLSHGAAVFLDRALPESPGIARVRIATNGTKSEKKVTKHEKEARVASWGRHCV